MAGNGNLNEERFEEKKPGVNYPMMIQRVFVALINKGQLIIGATLAVLIIMAVRMPPTSLQMIARQVMQNFLNYQLLGWFFALVSLLGWYATNRKLRQAQSDTIRRVERKQPGL